MRRNYLWVVIAVALAVAVSTAWLGAQTRTAEPSDRYNALAVKHDSEP